VIYSHYQFDHLFGCKAWVEAAEEDVQIIAHESTVKYLNERVSALHLVLTGDWPCSLACTSMRTVRSVKGRSALP